jgi:hypothetical protein
MSKLERADLLIFSFPLWWFSMRAILKGWVDRVLAMGRIYGNGKFYSGGMGRGKRAMILMTAGGPLPPFIVHAPAGMSTEDRSRELDHLEAHLFRLDELVPAAVPSVDQYEGLTGEERARRFMVELRGPEGAGPLASLDGLRRGGKLLSFNAAQDGESTFVAWLLIREHSRAAVEALMAELRLPVGTRYTIWQTSRRPG